MLLAEQQGRICDVRVNTDPAGSHRVGQVLALTTLWAIQASRSTPTDLDIVDYYDGPRSGLRSLLRMARTSAAITGLTGIPTT